MKLNHILLLHWSYYIKLGRKKFTQQVMLNNYVRQPTNLSFYQGEGIKKIDDYVLERDNIDV